MLQSIAVDEVRHAALSWAVARWILPRLPPEQRACVYQRQAEAVSELCREVEREPSTDLVDVAGLPTRSASRFLLDSARRELWQSLATSRGLVHGAVEVEVPTLRDAIERLLA